MADNRLEDIVIDEDEEEEEGEQNGRKLSSKNFYVGPIYLSEFIAALKLGGTAAGVYALIHHRTQYSRREWVTLRPRVLEQWGISVRAKTYALKRLEEAGLIITERPKGYSLKAQLVRKPKNWKPRKA